VSEITTSNNLLATGSYSGTPTLIKIEQKSPTSASITTSSMDNNGGGQQNNGSFKDPFFYGARPISLILLVLIVIPFLGKFSFLYTAGAAAIPIGIAVGRQRLQEATTNQTLQQLQPKDLNRFGLGLADLGKSNRSLLKRPSN
jgi:hypothetical protein